MELGPSLIDIDIWEYNADLISEDSLCKTISSYSSSVLSYKSFSTDHMLKNVPCLINSGFDDWSGLEWLNQNKTPNFDILDKKYGNISVPVANCQSQFYNAQKKEEQTLKEYLSYWKTYINRNYPDDMPCLYMKDWHFTRDFPAENIYRLPCYFSSDWLNEYFTARHDVHDDYRFVYMGPKGSWTPLHVDVFTSYSWSVNLCGRKRWLLYPPGEEKCLTDIHGNLAYDVESNILLDKKKFGNYNKLKISFEVIQHPGEAIFVPSGWHHQVWNLDDTISINHNWVNGWNIAKMWTSIRENLSSVKLEIYDCKEMENWHEHCQIMLNSVYGMDYVQFCKFLLYIANVRLKHLSTNTPLKVFGNWLIGINHLKYDLSQLRAILIQLTLDADFRGLNYYFDATIEISSTLQKIEEVLCNE